MRWSLLAMVVVLPVVTACSQGTLCPPGNDCRWLIDSGPLGLWVAVDPEMAVVVRVDLPEAPAVAAYGVWERCRDAVCAWNPPTTNGRLARQEQGAWVVSLTRSAFERDAAIEIVTPFGDGSRPRLGIVLPRDEREAVARPDLATCAGDLGATLAAALHDEAREVLASEVELACRIWLHPEQGRSVMRWHPTLHAVARNHACDMATRGFFGHVDPDGIGPNARARIAGYALPAWYDAERDGNNIESLALRGPETAPAITLEQWLASPLHRRHVLGEGDFVATQGDTAVGYCRGEQDGLTKHYWAFVSAHGAP